MNLIIGNGQLRNIICVRQHRLRKELSVLIKSQFGKWITTRPRPESRLCIVITNEQLGQQLSQFWELEDVSYREVAPHSCEKHSYEEQDTNWANRVRWRKNNFTERRLTNLSGLQQYIQFIRKYNALGHMSKINANSQSSPESSFYLPYHLVVKYNHQAARGLRWFSEILDWRFPQQRATGQADDPRRLFVDSNPNVPGPTNYLRGHWKDVSANIGCSPSAAPAHIVERDPSRIHQDLRAEHDDIWHCISFLSGHTRVAADRLR